MNHKCTHQPDNNVEAIEGHRRERRRRNLTEGRRRRSICRCRCLHLLIFQLTLPYLTLPCIPQVVFYSCFLLLCPLNLHLFFLPPPFLVSWAAVLVSQPRENMDRVNKWSSPIDWRLNLTQNTRRSSKRRQQQQHISFPIYLTCRVELYLVQRRRRQQPPIDRLLSVDCAPSFSNTHTHTHLTFAANSLSLSLSNKLLLCIKFTTK